MNYIKKFISILIITSLTFASSYSVSFAEQKDESNLAVFLDIGH